MAIEKDYSNAMNNLGIYYQKIEKDYDQMKKYYLMAIEKGHTDAINNLETYYQLNNDTLSLLKLYIKINDVVKISNLLIEYSNQTTLNEEITSILLEYLNSFNDTILPVSLKICKRLFNKQIDLLETHFKYTENGLGFNEAKKDFYQQLSSIS
jgi:TPR repeat protein